MLFSVRGPCRLIPSTGCWRYCKLLYVVQCKVQRGFARTIHNGVYRRREAYECLWLQWTVEVDSVWPVIAGTVSPTRAMHTHTHTHIHTQAHIAVVCAYTLTLMGRTDSCFVSLHLKKCVRLHNEADLCFLSLPLVNARLSGVEMSEFISYSLGRAELCLCVYSGRKLI